MVISPNKTKTNPQNKQTKKKKEKQTNKQKEKNQATCLLRGKLDMAGDSDWGSLVSITTLCSFSVPALRV